MLAEPANPTSCVTAQERIIEWSKEYHASDFPGLELKDGKTFYKVGHNASHDFYLGWDEQGNLFKRAVGEAWDDEDPEIKIEDIVRPIASLKEAGYIGHF